MHNIGQGGGGESWKIPLSACSTIFIITDAINRTFVVFVVVGIFSRVFAADGAVSQKVMGVRVVRVHRVLEEGVGREWWHSERGTLSTSVSGCAELKRGGEGGKRRGGGDMVVAVGDTEES